MKATAVAHGAASIVNAIAMGKGAAFGISLSTRAEVELIGEPKIQVIIRGDGAASPVLVKKCVERVFEKYYITGMGARVETISDIPIARGLKSSSVASNAVVLALMKALEKEIDDMEAVNLGVDSSLDAGVSVTGAFDDATASYFGGAVVTDNMKREIVARHELGNLKAVIYFPEKRILTSQTNIKRMKAFAPKAGRAWEYARKGKIFKAMNLNSKLYCKALGYDQGIADEALKAGALGASLSGTGPAFVALAEEAENIKEVWEKYEGTVKVVDLNAKKAG